jgi:hypothetical protein
LKKQRKTVKPLFRICSNPALHDISLEYLKEEMEDKAVTKNTENEERKTGIMNG